MRKKMNHTEKNINPIELKLKKIEQEIQNQFDYDYKRVMQQMKDKLGNIKKNKEQEKHIQEKFTKIISNILLMKKNKNMRQEIKREIFDELIKYNDILIKINYLEEEDKDI